MPKVITRIGALLSLALPLFCFSQQAGTGSSRPSPGPPTTVVFDSSVGNVTFPHQLHLKFGCAACHHQIHAGDLETPHPDYLDSSWISCEICHDASAAAGSPYYKCSECHHSEPTDIADETLSAKVVTHKSCWKCHASGTGVEASAGCGDCHVKEG